MQISGTNTDQKSDIKILVVDDREDNLFSIEAILEKDPYTIVRASSGRAALKILLTEHDFSLILMDVQMPDLNGFETATIIYERDKLRNIPIIFITAYSNDEDHAFRGYKMGGVDYIYKPINSDLLRAKVAVFVELYRKNRQLQLQEQRLLNTNKILQREIEERRVTEEKIRLLNEQLIQNNEHLKEMNEELDQFAYMASHDLQEPLRKIQLFSDKILVKKGQDEESERYFNKIIAASRRMQNLINNLLDFSRQSVHASDFKKTDLGSLLNDTLSELETEIEENQGKVNLGSLPTAWVVPGLMQQCFANIIRNALKFKKKEEVPVIDIKAEKLSGEALLKYTSKAVETAYYRITIRDNGIGFENQYNADIFKVFKRLHSYSDFQGSGVGLSICKKIVEKHGGYIHAEGEPGVGALFTIVIPEMQSN